MELHKLTRDEIADALRTKEVGIGKKNCPIEILETLAISDEYDPESFSEEIEHSDVDLGIWLKNHSKICKYQFVWLPPMKSVVHEDGTENFYSEANVDAVVAEAKRYGGFYYYVR